MALAAAGAPPRAGAQGPPVTGVLAPPAARSWVLDARRRQAEWPAEAAASGAASALVRVRAKCRSDLQAAWSIRTERRTAEGLGTQSRAAGPPVHAAEPPVPELKREPQQRIAGSGRLARRAPAG